MTEPDLIDGTPAISQPSARVGFPIDFVHTEGLEEGLARLQFLTDHHCRCGVITGPAGVGKSLLQRVFAEQCRERGFAVRLINASGFTAQELLWQLVDSLGLNPDPSDLPLALWQRLRDDWLGRSAFGESLVLLIDHLDDCGLDVGLTVRRLFRLADELGLAATFVLTLRAPCPPTWSTQLRDEADLRITLPRWEFGETAEFLQRRFADRGEPQRVVEPDAARLIHQLADGIPASILRLGDLAWLAATAMDVSRIDVSLVRGMAHELGDFADAA